MKGRIRVAFCIDNMNVGGTELNAVRTAERLDRSRFSLQVISLQEQGPLVDRYRAARVPVRSFPISSLYGPSTVRQGFLLARFLRSEQIQVLHAHDIYSNAFAIPWARAAGAKTIASRRWWQGFPGWHWKLATRGSYQLAHAVLANSGRVADLLRTEAVPSRKITVVPNFVDEAAFDALSADERRKLLASLGVCGEEGPILGVVANLNPIKDHETMFQALSVLRARWPRIRLVLVGDGPHRPVLEEQVRSLGLGNSVTFVGRRPNQPNLHHLFDLSILCSVSEGLPNSVLEAMAAARPVVATDVGATADAVIDEETGFLVPPSNPERLAAAIHEVLCDPERARRMGVAGRRLAESKYSPAAALLALEALYDRLAGSIPGKAPRTGANSLSPARVW